MPRYRRIVAVGSAHHVTQRGNQRQVVFNNDEDRAVYLALLKDQAEKACLRIWGYCLMRNHVHLIAVPEREDSLARGLGRAHYRYAHYFQAKRATVGHLWQNRFYSCPLGTGPHLALAMAYVEQNPVRAGLVERPEQYPWSSARAHLWGTDGDGLLATQEWTEAYPPERWREMLSRSDVMEARAELEACTFSGKPFGGGEFREALARLHGRSLVLRKPGRPRKPLAVIADVAGA